MTEITTLVDQWIGPAVAALLTIMVLSYLIGDNAFFRVATHIFVGVAAGYAGALALREVLWPGLAQPLAESGLPGLLNPTILLTVVAPGFLALLLLFKLSTGTARLGSLSLALLVGVGAAVVVGGAITGTLIPQSVAAMNTLNPLAVAPQTGETGLERLANVFILLAGTLSTLAYFRFTVSRTEAEGRRPGPLALLGRGLRLVGGGFLALTFGVMYAGALSATILVMAERIQFLRDAFVTLLSGAP